MQERNNYLMDSNELTVRKDRLTLKKALEMNRLDDFVAQEEARGFDPIDRAELDAAIAKILTPPQSEDQTSRSPSSGGSTGK